MQRQITDAAEGQTSEPLRWWLRIDYCVAKSSESMKEHCSLYLLFGSVIVNSFS